MTAPEMKNTTAHEIAVSNVRGGADGTKSPEKEPTVTIVERPTDKKPVVRFEERKTPAQILQELATGEGDHTPVAYIEHEGTIARIDRWCWRGDEAIEHENSLELVLLETNFDFHPSGAYQIELSPEGVEHLLEILSAALPVMKKAA